jgi:FkbM family methyltransferase
MKKPAIIRTIDFITQHPLNKKHKVSALWRFLSWQIKCTINKGFHQMPFAEKSKILAKKGLAGATGNIYCGLHEFEDMAFLLHFLRKKDLFIDVGANIGSYTILAASEVGAEAISFEPLPKTFNILKENIAINKLEHLAQLYNNGVGNETGVLRFTNDLDTINHVIMNDDTKDGIKVRIVSIDNTAIINKPCLIKIDVEGFETEVLKGMENTLKNVNVKALIIELNGSGSRYGYDESAIHNKLLNLNYKLYEYAPLTRTLKSVSHTNSDNKIFIRDFSFVQKRIEGARKIQINRITF